MTTKLICPECGGTIGERTSPSEVPCTCVAKPVGPSAEEFKAAAAGNDDSARGAKVCRVCGKDVTGKKRYKDSLGYWCAACHEAEKKGRAAGQKQCTECLRWFPEDKLIDSDVERLCYTCNRNRNAQRREILRKAAKGRIHNLYERKQLLILTGIFLLLLVLILMQRAGWIGSGG